MRRKLNSLSWLLNSDGEVSYSKLDNSPVKLGQIVFPLIYTRSGYEFTHVKVVLHKWLLPRFNWPLVNLRGLWITNWKNW